MASNDDLFAGFTVGKRQVPTQQQQVATSAGIDSNNADLFAGLTVGQSSIPAQQQQRTVESPLEPGQISIRATTPEPEISPFPEQPGETRAAAELPEVISSGILSGESGATVAAITPVLLATTNPQEFANILKSNFPDTIGIQTSPAGEVIVANNKTGVKAVVNQEGFSGQDVLQTLGIISAFTPAARGAGLVSGLGAKVATGGAGAGLTQAAIEGLQQQSGGEFDEDEIAIATALGGAAETVLPAIQALRQSRRVAGLGIQRAEVEATREAIRPAQEATAAVEAATGQRVGLFPAQQTQVPSELLKQRVLPQLDAGAKKAAASLETQNKEVFDATSELINTVAPAESVGGGATRFRTASQKALESSSQARSQAVKGLYNDALEQGADVELSPVSGLIDDILADAPPGSEFVKTGKKLGNLLKPPKDGVKPSLKQLQKAKLSMQDMVNAVGDKSVSNTMKREIIQVKQSLVDQMSEASPLFRAAEDEFARLSPAVKELNDSIIGQISKTKDVNIKNIAQRIFDPKEGLTNPTVIKNAKAVIDQADPGAWNDLLRIEMERRVGGLIQIAEGATGDLVGNVPGQLRSALFGNPSQRNALMSGMSAEQKKNFGYLESVLKRASSGRAAGSPTASFGEAIKKLRGVSGAIRDLIFRPLKTVGETGERGLFDRNVSALTDVMFDPRFEPQLRQLRELNPNSPAAARAFTQIINSAQEKGN